MARPPSADSIIRNMKRQQFEPKTPIASEMFLPNVSNVDPAYRKDGSAMSPFTQGSVMFIDENKRPAEDNSNFFWDDTNNRLGIGTTSPSAKTEVIADTSNSENIFYALNNDETGGVRIKSDANGHGTLTVERAGGAAGWFLDSDGDSYFKPTAGNNFGVGTTSPDSPLTIKGVSNAAAIKTLASDNGRSVEIGTWTADNGVIRIFHNDGSENVRLRTDGDSYFTGGNVGIGTTSPSASLHIVDNAFPVSRVERTTTGTVGINSGYQLLTTTSGNMANSFGGGMLFAIQDDTSGIQNVGRIAMARDGADNSGTMYFETYDAGARKIRMTIDAAGNVAIGEETAPVTKLEVLDGTSATLTLHNTEHTDTDGDRLGSVSFRGEQSGGEEHVLAKVEVVHDGGDDDQKGRVDWYVNDGNDGVAPTLRFSRIQADGKQTHYNGTDYVYFFDGTYALNVDTSTGEGASAKFYDNSSTVILCDGSDNAITAGDATNNTNIDSSGDMTFNGTARIDWAKKTADSVTASGFTAVGQVVGDLQTANDGNVYTATEVAGGGNNIIVDFVSITAFNWVKILASYDGSGSHGIYIEVYNWNTTSWEQFDCMQNAFTDTGALFCNHDFLVPSDTNYIGTGGDAGKVRVRFNHNSSTVNNHKLYIDEVSLQQ